MIEEAKTARRVIAKVAQILLAMRGLVTHIRGDPAMKAKNQFRS